RRHTRLQGDWSSDVCSSDLRMSRTLAVIFFIVALLSPHSNANGAAAGKKLVIAYAAMNARVCPLWAPRERGFFSKYGFDAETLRSEERRVGKECRSRW